MSIVEYFTKLVNRLRYPASLPGDIAEDLGISLPTTLSFNVLMDLLSSPSMRPKRLAKFMRRQQAESVFRHALKKECFVSCSLFSYYFTKGWVVIALYFDEESRLRRVYLQGPACERREGVDLFLEEASLLFASAVSSR